MSELKPCPFCGGDEVRIALCYTPKWYYGECEDCNARTDYCLSQAEAIAAWNSRAERTCNLHGEWKRISQTQEVRHLYCDCGEHLGSDKRNLILECKADLPNYCPNCGARVVGE